MEVTRTVLGVVDAEIYDPALGTWSVLAPFQHQHILGATVLFNGEVVVIGGGIKDVERLDLQPVPTPTPAPTPVPTTPCVPVRGACWQSLTALGVIQGYPVAVALSLSSILAVGQPDVNFPLFTTEVFSGGSWVQGRDFSSLVCPSLTTLPSGQVLLLDNGNSNAQLYDPVTNAWQDAASQSAQKPCYGGVILVGSDVLFVGGQVGAGVTTECRKWQLGTGFVSCGDLAQKRFKFTINQLQDGCIAVFGGTNGISTRLYSVEIYDPASNTWSSGGNMLEDRFVHVSTVLSDGRVLLATGFSSSAEIYNGMTQTSTWTGSLTYTRQGADVITLPSG